MRLQGISVHLVRNEYEYEKFVPADYRSKYDWNASKPSMPWCVIEFSREAGPEDIGECMLTFKGIDADFTNINAAPSGEWAPGSDKAQLKVYPEKMGRLMLDLFKDMGLTSTPTGFEVVVTDKNGVDFTAKYEVPSLLDVKVLDFIDRAVLQQGETAEGLLLYELAAATFNVPVRSE